MSDTELEGLIRESGLTGITEDMMEKLSGFADLLLKWNRVYNLTGVRTRGEMLVRNIMDSLVILPYLRGAVCLDAGTGPGLPGIPLAIARPDISFALVDSRQKRISFVREAVRVLGLTNVTPVLGRLESIPGDGEYDMVTSRAFSSLSDFAGLTGRFLKKGGRLLAMKGNVTKSELEPLGALGFSAETHALSVPHYDGARHLVIMGMIND